MRVILFGASGMIGRGVLLESIAAPDVAKVLVVGRTPCGVSDPKVEEILHSNFLDLSSIEEKFAGFDGCFYCLGISSAGMSEADYTRITYDFTVVAAEAILRRSPGLVFCFVSGTSTDSTEKGSSMWARVKGRAENKLLQMRFRAAYMFRPGIVQPLAGIKSKTALYRAGYAVMKPLFPALKALFPRLVTTTAHVGKAMLRVVREGAPKTVLENPDINELGA
jgi:uncharacterized protein YbjT (DUF2867 family)